MTKEQSVEKHVSAASERWDGAKIVNRTTDVIVRQDGVRLERGKPKFEIDFSEWKGAQKSVLAAQTTKSVLSTHGYQVFYAPKRKGLRDPRRLIVVITSSSDPVE